MPASPTAVTAEFAGNGTCVVSIDGTRVAARPSSVGSRCELPYASLGKQQVVLRVIMPPGSGPAADSFPRLGWYREADRVIGTATLPSAPAFVSIGHGSGPVPSSFGWNFYGFAVFAVAFIAAYFTWAGWMARRDRARAAAR